MTDLESRILAAVTATRIETRIPAAVLQAIADAGFDLVKRGEWIAVQPDASGAFGATWYPQYSEIDGTSVNQQPGDLEPVVGEVIEMGELSPRIVLKDFEDAE